MVAYVYEFWVKEDQGKILEESWQKVTELYLAHCGSLGSRLHKTSASHYVAYAMWPSPETRDSADLSDRADYAQASKRMHNSCTKITSSDALNPVCDLLKA